MAFTIDLEYFDTECKRITGDMAYFFDCTIDERNFREDADEMQKEFIDALNTGALDDLIIDAEMPIIHNVCMVQYSEHGFAAGIGSPVFINVVLVNDTHKADVTTALHQKYGADANILYHTRKMPINAL